MPFFQNPFDQEFRGNLPIGDRQYTLTFSVPANRNTSNYTVAYNCEPYDFSSLNTLTIKFALDKEYKAFASLAINIAGATASATKAAEVVSILNANATFSWLFTAEVHEMKTASNTIGNSVIIKTNKSMYVKHYILNSSAESKMKFNKYAGVAEIPSYFSRHTINNVYNYTDSAGMLIQLDGTDTAIDRPIIREFLNDTTWTNSSLKSDYQLLEGRSGLFTFRKQTVDSSSRITQIIEYPAGAIAGDFAKKITMSYTGSKTQPDSYAEVPYVLQSGDLITPP